MLHFRDLSLWLRAAIALAFAAAVAAAWHWTSLGQYTDPGNLAALSTTVRESPYAIAIVLSAFIVFGLAFMPLTALVTATALTFDPLRAFALATSGTLASALAGFTLGHFLGAAPLRRLAGPTVRRLSHNAGRHGVMLVTTLRLVPIAHFTLINLFSGATQVRLRDFVIGTLLGCIPGIAAIAVIGGQAQRFFREPDLWSLLWLALIAALGIGMMHFLRRRLRTPPDSPGSRRDDRDPRDPP